MILVEVVIFVYLKEIVMFVFKMRRVFFICVRFSGILCRAFSVEKDWGKVGRVDGGGRKRWDRVLVERFGESRDGRVRG